MTIKNKSILITGAASGIGKACAELFAREGARLVLADRHDAALQTLSASLRSSASRDPSC